MDEFDQLRSAYPEQPAPSREVTEQARSQVLTLAREAAAQPARRVRRITPVRLGIGLTAGAAAATVAALAVPLMLSPDAAPDTSAPPATTTAPATTQTAGQVLVAAAFEQERAEASSGKYFRVRTLSVRPLRIGAGKSAYTLNLSSIQETWTGAKGGTSWAGHRELGAKPATPADVAKWRQAGSPATWNLGPTDTIDRHDMILSSKPDKGRLDELKGQGDRYYALGKRQGVTSAEVRALPTEPAALRQRLLADKAFRAPDADDTSYLAMMTARLLMDTPALPKVRGAGLRLLAGLPGAAVQHDVKDLQGRAGTAVTFSFPQARLSIRLIIEPGTGKLLSSGHWGGKTGSETVLAAGWTNDEPRVPATALR